MVTYCTVCKALISEKRAARGSHFCSEPCHEAYRKQRRDWRASRYCRLCGREARPPRKTMNPDPVHSEHNSSEKLMEGEL
jgi:predicted nucleic acid-binding Zn ribbon protein